MAFKGRIRFRCWYCNRKHVAGWDQVGERRVCNCGERYRVPRRAGIARRDKRLLDWVLEFVIYGGGGGFLGGLFGVVILSRARTRSWEVMALVIGGLACFGFLAGALFGERGINWLGEQFDSRRTPGQ
jgi:hypothetical protein